MKMFQNNLVCGVSDLYIDLYTGTLGIRKNLQCFFLEKVQIPSKISRQQSSDEYDWEKPSNLKTCDLKRFPYFNKGRELLTELVKHKMLSDDLRLCESKHNVIINSCFLL